MANNSTAKKVMHVSEEMAPAVHIPIMVGNEIFVLTQQDIRRVEDIRLLSYNRLGPNGQFSPVDTSSPGPMNFSQPNTSNFCALDDLIRNAAGKRETSNPVKTVASVSTQLGWSKKKVEAEPLFPLCYSAGTSTCGLMTNTGCQHCPRCETHHSSCQTQNFANKPPTVENEIPQNASCQTQTCPGATSIVKKESPPKNASCQTQSCLSANSYMQKEPLAWAYQAQPITNSTGCGTSHSHLFETTSAGSYTSAECDYTSSAESNSPCRHCKSQQTCTEQELMVPVQPQVQSPIRPQEQPCTSRQIRVDLPREVRHCNNLEEPHFYRSYPLGKTPYPRSPVSNQIRKKTYGLTGYIGPNSNHEMLQQEQK
uniref:GG16990 n=1 Tax=Drosophila erecta TaxID=7220 RepID=B3P101_DROER